MLDENKPTSNVPISVFVRSQYLALCTEYILDASKLLANTVCENQFSQLLVNLCENVRECRQIFGICLYSAILGEVTYVWIQL